MDFSETESENQCIKFDLIDKLSNSIIEKIKNWANETIFHPVGGNLEIEILLKESVNAGAIANPSAPMSPTIIIHMGMIYEIYRDSISFPLYSEKLANETDNFKLQNWEAFETEYFKFESGVPSLTLDEMSEISSLYTGVFQAKFEEEFIARGLDLGSERVKAHRSSINCRFIMFELMLVWVCFHELAHLIQGHYRLKAKSSEQFEYFELNNAEQANNLKGQSREILADIEGLELTLAYINRENICNYKTCYLLLCSVTCMFNRFFNGKYPDNYNTIQGTHPHPVIRGKFMDAYFLKYMQNNTPLVWKPDIRNSILIGYGYLTARSCMAGSLFWANRYLGYDGNGYPLYVELDMKTQSEEGKKYKGQLSELAAKQLDSILKFHVLTDSVLFSLKESNFFE